MLEQIKAFARRFRWSVALTLLCAVVAVAATQITDTYSTARLRTSSAAPVPYRTVTSGAPDSIVTSVAIDPQAVFMGDTTLVVYTRHSTGGTTAQVEVWLYGQAAGFIGIADVQTATSTAHSDGTDFFPIRPLYFPLNGATTYDVRVTNVSAGDVDVLAHSIGQGSIAAD